VGLQLSPSRMSNLLAVVAIAGIIGAFLLVIHATNREMDAYGPSVITSTTDGDVYFVAGDRLYRTDSGGKLLDTVAFKDLGIEGPVTQLTMLDANLLLIDAGRDDILRCDTSLWRCSRLFAQQEKPISDVLSLALAPAQQKIYLTSFSTHRLCAVDLETRDRYSLQIPGGLKYPNAIVWLGADRLLVADTNQHRVIEIEELGEGKVQLIRSFAVKSDQGLAGQRWPTDVVRNQEGGTWVIFRNAMLHHGALIYFDREGQLERRVELGEDADPLGITLIPGGVLLSDAAFQRLLFVSQADFSLTRFGDDALQAVLTEISSQQAYWHRIYYLGIWVIVFFLALGGVAGYLDWQVRHTLRKASAATSQTGTKRDNFTIPHSIRASIRPDAQGVFWLTIAPRTIRWFKLLGFFGPLLLLLSQVYFVSQLEDESVWTLLLPIVSLALLVAAVIVGMTFAMGKIRLGTDGSRLYLVDLFGRCATAPPEQCINTGRRLLIGKISVPIGHSHFTLYDKEHFAALIEPMLERVPRSNELAIYWRYLRAGDPLTWLGSLAFILLIASKLWFDL